MSVNPPKDFGNIKQKIIIGVLGLIVLIIVWQAYSIFGGGGSSESTPAVTPATNMSAASPGAASSPASAAGLSAGAVTAGASSTIGSAPAVTALNQPRQDTIQQNTEILKIARQTETKYVAALSELEMLKLERDIAETNQAITLAKLTTVTTEQNIADLLTKVTLQGNQQNNNQQGNSMQPEGTGPVSSSMLGPNGTGYPGAPAVSSNNAINTPNPPKSPAVQPKVEPVVPVVPDVAYDVLSVSYQDNKWNAIMSTQSIKPNSFSIGDVLPADNSIIVGINKDGVTLKKGEKRRTIALRKPIY